MSKRLTGQWTARARCGLPARLAAAVLALAISACAGTTMTQDASPPSKPDDAKPPLLQSTNVIHVLPVAGIDGPLKLVLADAVAATLRDSERPAVLAKDVNNQGPTVIGRVDNMRTHGSVIWITTVWELRAPYGTVVSNRRREIVIDKKLWDARSVEIVNLIVGDAMPAVADMVQDHVGPLHVQQGVRSAHEKAETPAPAMAPETPGAAPEAPPAETAEAVPDATPMAPATPPGDAVPTMEKAAAESVAPKTAAAPMPAAAPPPTPAASKPPMILAPKKAATSPSPPAGPAGPAADDVVDLPSADPLEPNVPPDTAAPATPEPPPVAVPEPVPATARGGIAAAPGDTPVVWGRPSFLVRPVRGAPGDGNKALNAALRAALRGKDLTVTDDPRQAGYEVVGAVEVGPPVNGRQRARISWVINTIAGEEVGKAVQENVIAAGSLDGAWGRVAVVVSAAAADGIQQLFDAPRPKFTPVGKVPDFPKVPTLPRVPGRALPPPPS